MKKIFNKFLIGVLFLLGIILIPAFKADATIAVTVKVDGSTSPKTIAYGTTVLISWEAPGATSCNSGGHGTDATGSFYVTPTTTTTFTVNCTSPDRRVGVPLTAYYGYNSIYGTCGQPTTVFTDSTVSSVVSDILLWRDRNLTNPFSDSYITNDGGDTYQVINSRVGQIVYISC